MFILVLRYFLFMLLWGWSFLINDFIIKLIDVFNGLYVSFVASRIQGIISILGTWRDSIPTMRYYLQGVYFIIGKPLCVYIIAAFVLILLFRLTFAIINIIGQYVP